MANERLGYLKVGTTTFKSVSTLTLSNNKIWSTDTGRTATGKMTGKIIDVKKKLEVSWKYLTKEEVNTISKLVDSKTAFHTIEYYDIAKNKIGSFTGYFGDGTYPVYGFDAQRNACVTGMSLSIIEK